MALQPKRTSFTMWFEITDDTPKASTRCAVSSSVCHPGAWYALPSPNWS